MLLNYRAVSEPGAIAPTIPLRDFLKDQVPTAVLAKLKQRVILVGNIASSASDRWKTPTHPQSSGVYLQAQMISQLVSSVENGRSLISWWPEWLELIWIIGWSLGMAGIYMISKKNMLAIALGGILVSVICYVGFIQALWLPWIPALAGMLITGLLIGITTKKQDLRHSGSRVIDS
jgi:CHASE2 domain-containing sensor protein